jgi:uncharacterized ferritin-like protein (DUF455 family)
MADLPPLDPARFADAPARDARFTVVERWSQCCNLPKEDPACYLEFLHRQMAEEVDGLECAARMLQDFPDADWTLQMAIARQCYDESRHVEMFRRLYERRGGTLGQYPVMAFQYRIITRIPDLLGRLAVQNRAFETEGVDAVEPEIAAARARGDEAMADLSDAQLADEICHVRYANTQIGESTARDPAAVMRIGRALEGAARAFEQVMGEHAIGGTSYGVNREGRLEAGFTPAEIDLAERLRANRRTSAG